MFNSDAYQDRFVYTILKRKQYGYFVDIGSCWATNSNNTYCFENMGWRGICVEINKTYSDGYKNRKCKFINDDATKVNYDVVFSSDNAPKMIDYLSLDVDERSTDVLKLLPHQNYQYSVITIEHDFYIYGDVYLKQQREILSSLGYHLLASKVKVPRNTNGRKEANTGFEDWWTHSSLEKNHLFFDQQYPEDILSSI